MRVFAMFDKSTNADAKDKAKPNFTLWMEFIQPHISNYERAAPGERKRYLENVSKKHEIGERNLRRFIAAAQYLALRGITQFPDTAKRMPVAAVENIMRIGQYDPLRAKMLLQRLVVGEVTVDQLINELKRLKEGKASILSFRLDEDDIAAELKKLPRPEGRLPPSAKSFFEFEYSNYDKSLFDEIARPSGVAYLSDGRRLLILDETLAAWDVSPRRVILAFLASTAVALTVADLVLVCTIGLEDNLHNWRNSMVESTKSRLLLLRGRMDLQWEDPLPNPRTATSTAGVFDGESKK